ncbi:MAG: MFS transporter [Verrucomicrobia bacterium]|nr:MFS transporter [Verrucomicrobiota bacterium]
MNNDSPDPNTGPALLRAYRSLSPQQRKSGLAAWLGWLFDGLDMHIYTLVATPFVAALLLLPATHADVGFKSSIIQAAFLVGWAFGGTLFGRIGDIFGRSRALILTILCYSVFTGLSALSTEWWHLLIFRFLSALGIGGEWAVGASLLSETWPKRWRPWIAAILQTAVNLGILLACFSGWILESANPRWIFVVGVLPALITLWIRRAVPETEEWTAARNLEKPPGISALFARGVASITWRALAICGVALTAHWAFMFWQQKFIRNHPEIINLSGTEKNRAAVHALTVLMLGSIAGNFIAGGLAKKFGYRRSIAAMMALYGICMALTFVMPWSYQQTLCWFVALGICSGVFGLFTMCLPPVFPTLLRSTGSGFCYNFGRLAAAGGTVLFGLFNTVSQPGLALLYASTLFLPAALLALILPEPLES